MTTAHSVTAPAQSTTQTTSDTRLSVVIPIFNEEDNVPILCARLFPILERFGWTYEVIAVNDGSRDGSLAALQRATVDHPALKIIDFRLNCGQTAAMMAGFDHAIGDIIVALDADLQNDPEDIPALVAKLEEGYDVVSGWRKDRQDAAMRRNLVSRVANRLISRVSGVALHDYGCTLKAYRSAILKEVRLYGEMHRFIPIYAAWHGARVTEIPVRHHPRIHGKSKYGLERIFKVLLDLIVVKFLHRYLTKPIYVFGGFGLALLLISFAALAGMLLLKCAYGVAMIQTPLPVLSAMCFTTGIMAILLGLMAEIMMRTYFESQRRVIYTVRALHNF